MYVCIMFRLACIAVALDAGTQPVCVGGTSFYLSPCVHACAKPFTCGGCGNHNERQRGRGMHRLCIYGLLIMDL